MGWRDRSYSSSEDSFRARTASSVWPTPMVWAVLVAIGGTWLVQQFEFRIGIWLMLWLDGDGLRQPWRWLTFPLVHFVPIHAFLAGLVVYLFLPQLEREWGWLRALACFLIGNLVGAGVYALFSIGSSGTSAFYGSGAGALAVLTAAAYRLPREHIFDAVPNRLMAALVGVIWVLFIIGGRQASDLAHLAGIPFGLAAGALSQWKRRPKRPRVVPSAVAVPAPRAYPKSHTDDALSLDEVLDKVSRHGIDSLSPDERRTLEIATERRRRGQR